MCFSPYHFSLSSLPINMHIFTSFRHLKQMKSRNRCMRITYINGMGKDWNSGRDGNVSDRVNLISECQILLGYKEHGSLSRNKLRWKIFSLQFRFCLNYLAIWNWQIFQLFTAEVCLNYMSAHPELGFHLLLLHW